LPTFPLTPDSARIFGAPLPFDSFDERGEFLLGGPSFGDVFCFACVV
jgi:hypothetical protein